MFREILKVALRHGYYDPDRAPVAVVPDDPVDFAAQGLVLRTYEGASHIVTERAEVPEKIALRVMALTPDILSVTEGAQWARAPIIVALLGDETPALDTVAPPTKARDPHAPMILAHLIVAMSQEAREITVNFEPIAAHWAYHIVGKGAEATQIYDPEGAVEFAPLPPTTLPDGRPVVVLCSTRALPARARTPHRFALKTPGPFGPKTLIPVLPAPGPDFVSLAEAGSGEPRVQSNIYVSIV